VPDLIIRQDTLTTPERTFATALASSFGVYRDALTATALDAKNRKLVASEGFEVTPAMRLEVLRRLRAKGAQVSDETFAGARNLVDEQLGYELARYVFGRQAEFGGVRHRTPDAGRTGPPSPGTLPKDLLTVAATRAGVSQEN